MFDSYIAMDRVKNVNKEQVYLWGNSSSVDKTSRYKLYGPGIEPRWAGEIFSTRPDLPSDPPSLFHNGYRATPI